MKKRQKLLTEEQWELVEPMLPHPSDGGTTGADLAHKNSSILQTVRRSRKEFVQNVGTAAPGCPSSEARRKLPKDRGSCQGIALALAVKVP